jgi:Fic family protein
MRAIYIHQLSAWPNFTWDNDLIIGLLADVRYQQGKLFGIVKSLGFTDQNESLLANLSEEVVKTAEIEGQNLDNGQVRSSIARKLGLEIAGLVPSDRLVDGVVDVILDATQNYDKPISEELLFSWHNALFPGGRSGIYTIEVAKWRTAEKGPMQVISGAYGKERVHFEAPEAGLVSNEMKKFIHWFNSDSNDPVLKAGIGHLWFLTIHPFDDGNGRIARALTEKLLSQSENSGSRFYSLSSEIYKRRAEYYTILESTQKGSLDITSWLVWFLGCFADALSTTEKTIESILVKKVFWDRHTSTPLNDRQRMIINRLFDGFEGNLNSSKYAKICKCSADTALRDINDLITKGILEKNPNSGKNTSYNIIAGTS